MLRVPYLPGSAKQEVLQLSRSPLKGTITGNRWTYNNKYLKGYMEFEELENGLHLTMFESDVKSPFALERMPTKNNTIFTLIYAIGKNKANVVMSGAEPLDEMSGKKFTGIFLSSSKAFIQMRQAAHNSVKGIRVNMSEQWLQKHFASGANEKQNLIDKILVLDHPVYLFEFLDNHSAHIVNEMFEAQTKKTFTKVKLLQLTYDLLYTFFIRLVEREPVLSKKFHFDDFQKIQSVQHYLVSDFTKPFPNLDELSTMANMSYSKFSRLFKQVFGLTVHQYYQQARMTKARELLESGKYTVQEVALRMSYQHQGKFAEAFKAQFNISPKEVKMKSRDLI